MSVQADNLMLSMKVLCSYFRGGVRLLILIAMQLPCCCCSWVVMQLHLLDLKFEIVSSVFKRLHLAHEEAIFI